MSVCERLLPGDALPTHAGSEHEPAQKTRKRARTHTHSQNKTHLVFSSALVHVPPHPAVSAASFVLWWLCVCQIHHCQLHKLTNPPTHTHPPPDPHPCCEGAVRPNPPLRRKRRGSNSFWVKSLFTHGELRRRSRVRRSAQNPPLLYTRNPTKASRCPTLLQTNPPPAQRAVDV